MKVFDVFLIFAQNIDCGYTLEPPARRGGSNEYPQSMFWSKNKKNRYIPCKPQFYYTKVGFKGVYISWTCYPDWAYNVRSCSINHIKQDHVTSQATCFIMFCLIYRYCTEKDIFVSKLFHLRPATNMYYYKYE